jgi:hypothetical protein
MVQSTTVTPSQVQQQDELKIREYRDSHKHLHREVTDTRGGRVDIEYRPRFLQSSVAVVAYIDPQRTLTTQSNQEGILVEGLPVRHLHTPLHGEIANARVRVETGVFFDHHPEIRDTLRRHCELKLVEMNGHATDAAHILDPNLPRNICAAKQSHR